MLMNKKVSMEIINANAAGIDVGSRSHFVAIGQSKDDVREFGVYNEDLKAIAEWLIENDVKTVAMESTGTYWQSLFAVLQAQVYKSSYAMASSLKTSKVKRQMYRIASGYKSYIQ
jgi:transposase